MAEKSAAIEFGRYLMIVREKRYVALAVGLAVLSALVWGSFAMPKSYKADSTVFVQRGTLIQQYMKGSGADKSLADELKILQNSLTSRNILDKVIKKLDMDLRAKNQGQYEALIDDVRKNLQITVKGSGGNVELFTISYLSGNPAQARDFVNALVNEYIEESIASRRNSAVQAYTFLDDQLAIQKKKLDDADQQITAFTRSHPEVMNNGEYQSGAQLGALQSSEMDAEIKLKELQRKKDKLAAVLAGKRKLTEGLNTKDDPLQNRLKKLNGELLVLTTKYTDQYPDVIKVKNEINLIKKKIALAGDGRARQAGASANPVYQQIKDELAQTDQSIEDLNIQLSEMSKQRDSASRLASSLPSEMDELAQLERQRNDIQRIYDGLSQQLEQAKVSKNFQMSDYSSVLRVVDPAVLPFLPAKPDRVKMIIAGLIMGLAAGIGAAIGLDYLNNSYKDEDTLEKGLRLPVLISIPHVVTEADKKRALKRDLRIFGIAGVYVLLILGLLVRESLFRYMGIKIFPL